MSAPNDELYGRLAVQLGYITQENLAEAVKNQRAMREGMGIEQPLQPILLGKGLLTDVQARDLARAVALETGEKRIVAGYEVVTKLGQGAMGTVFKAKKLDTGKLVALKVLPPSLADERTVARFARESAIVQELDHDHIVSCVEFGYDEEINCHFCALELVEGEDLFKRLTREGTLDEEAALSITSQIAMALQHAHFNGLVHRDVKPENIMVTPEGTAKLLDLGLARYAGADLPSVTQSGVFVGSPYYASVEQARGDADLDIRSDIYSLGGTLYHMLTGNPPFEGSSVIEVLNKHIKDTLPWPADVNPEVSDGLCRVIAKMMAKSPSKRYQEPNDLLDDLDLLEEGEEPKVEESVLHSSSIARPKKPRGKRKRRPGGIRKSAQRPAAGRAKAEGGGGGKGGSGGAAKGDKSGKSTVAQALALAAARPKTALAVGAGLVVVAGVVVSALVARGGPRRRQFVPVEAPDEFLTEADSVAGRHYRLYAKPMKWFDAFRFCKGAGGHLAAISSPEENAFVSELAAKAGGHAWIGLTDERVAGEWLWVTGEAGQFAAWGDAGPDSGGGRHWAAIDPASGGAWAARGGEGELPFVCEWDAVAAGPGLLARYFKGGAFDELLTQRVDPRVEISLGRPDELWVRWTALLSVPAEGAYVFRAVGGGGGVRLWVGGEKIINKWTEAAGEEVGNAELAPGRVPIKLEWAKGKGPGAMALSWGGPGMPIGVIPGDRFHTPTSGSDSSAGASPDPSTSAE